MKRLLAVSLIVVMIFGVSVTGYAAPKWKTGGGLPPGLQKQITLAVFSGLKDLDEVPWAKHAMEKMSVKGLIKGYGDKTFRPMRSVTKLEAVIMALRVMGWEEKALRTSNLPSGYKGKKVDQWAWGYVKVAAEKGILDEVDLMYFNPNEPAKRWEVAKYMVRALGYEDEAEAHMDEELEFKDYPAIPVGAVGYVYVISDLGLMVGNADGTFNPNRAVTRAEMAVLIDRIDGKVDSDADERDVEGRVVDINTGNNELVLDVDGDGIEYRTVEGIQVYYDGKYYDFGRLKEGDMVEILLNDEGRVVFIELKDRETDKLIEDFRGEVKALDVDDREITVKSGTAIFIFTVKSTADIEVNGEEADLEDIRVGDEVRLKVDNYNRVMSIKAEGDREDEEEETAEVEGTVYAITLGSVKGITIKLDSGQVKTYNVDDDTEITLDGEDAALADLESGMAVEMAVEGTLALEIDAETEDIREVEGRIYDIDEDEITVKYGSAYKTLAVDQDTDIEIDGEDAGFDDLAVNMEVEVRYRAGLALRIRAENTVSGADGVITAIDGDDEEITVEDDGDEEDYCLEDADIYVDDDAADFDDLKLGMEVEVRIINRTVVETVYAELDSVAGEVVRVDEDDMEIKLELYGDTETYDLDEDVEVELDGEEADLEDIDQGMEVRLEFDGCKVVKIDG